MNPAEVFTLPSLKFCNREDELSSFKGILSKPNKNPTGFLLTGEPGIGKTTLSNHVIEEARARGYLVLLSEAEQHGLDVAYHGIKSLINVAPLQEKDAFDSRNLNDFWTWYRSRILSAETPLSRDLLASGVELIAKPLGTLIRHLDSQMEPHLALHKLFYNQESTFIEYLTYLTDSGPIIIVLDDFHWIDSPSVVVLEKFIEIKLQNQLVLLLLYRPYECSQNYKADHFAQKLQSLNFIPITLQSLPSKALNGSIRDAAPQLDSKVIQEVVNSAEGNPLLASEDLTLRLLEYKKGVLSKERVRSRSPVLSQRLSELVNHRSRFLSKKALQCLQIGACLGFSFRMKDIVAILGILSKRLGLTESKDVAGVVDLIEIPSVAEELERLGFLVSIEPIDHFNFRFSHPLVHEVIYQEVILTTRVIIHSCIAEVLEQRATQGIPINRAELGRHYKESKDFPKAFIAFLRTAQDSYLNESYLHASVQLQSAIESLDLAEASELVWKPIRSSSFRVYLTIKLAECLLKAGEFSAARDSCQRALNHSKKSNLYIYSAEAKYWLGKIDYFIGDDQVSINNYRECIDVFKRFKRQYRIARSLNALAASLVQIGSSNQAKFIYREALKRAKKLEKKRPNISIEIYQYASMVLDAKDSAYYLNRGIELIEGKKRFRQLALLWHNYGVQQYYLGDLENAQNAFKKARELFLQTISFELIYTLNSLGVLELIAGNYDAAGQYFIQAERRIVANFDRIWLSNNMAVLKHFQGKTAQGIDLLERLLPTIDVHSDPVIRENSYFNLGILYFHKGLYELAKDYVLKSINRNTLYNKHLAYAKRYRALAHIHKALGNHFKSERYKQFGKNIFDKSYLEKWSFYDNEFIFCHLSNYH